MSALFDVGLQPERTELAWQRTALALAVGSLIAIRLVPASLGNPWWALAGAAGIVVAAWIWQSARRRCRAVNSILQRHGDRAAFPSAGLLLAVTICVSAAGVLGLLTVLLSYGHRLALLSV